MDESDFDSLWRHHCQHVARYCHCYTQSAVEGDEVCQRVAIRAWRHFSSLRDRTTFLSWVLAIARREVTRWGSQRQTLRNRMDNLPSMGCRPNVEVEPIQGVGGGEERSAWLPSVIDQASAEAFLTAIEGAVLKARLAASDDNWASLGEQLGIDANCAAVTHCRAIPKLRVFLFIHRRDVLGGMEAIRTAYEQACREASPAMSDGEATAFDRIILRGEDKYRPNRWKVDLRAACAKVAKYLRGEFP